MMFKILFILLSYVYECFADMYVSTPCVCLVPKVFQKRASDLLGLELQKILSCHLGGGN